MDLTRRQTLAGMSALAAAGLFGLPARAQQKTLVVPTLGGVWEQYWRSTVAPAFTKQTGAAVTLDVGNGRVWGANLRAAGTAKPPYSIVMTNEVFASGLRKEGFSKSSTSPSCRTTPTSIRSPRRPTAGARSAPFRRSASATAPIW